MFGDSGAPGGTRRRRRGAGGEESVAREGLPRKSNAAFSLAGHARRPSAPRVALRASSPLPPRAIRDAGSVQSPRLLPLAPPSRPPNPVSNGYQHRASNVIRPAAAATSLRGEHGARARGRARPPAAPATAEGKRWPAGVGLTFPPEPSREHDSPLVRVTGRCREMRADARPAAKGLGGQGQEYPAGVPGRRPRSRYSGLLGVGWRCIRADTKPKVFPSCTKGKILHFLR